MSWQPYTGSFKLKWYPKKASQVLTYGALVDVIIGYIDVAAITSAPHSGVVQTTVTAADTDYASTTRLAIQVPGTPTSEWRVSLLSTDTAAATDVGDFVDIGGSPVGLDITNATSADDAALVTRILDTTSAASFYAVHLNSFKPMQNGVGSAI